MDRQGCCCWSFKVWARVIAWSQAVGFLILIIYFAVRLGNGLAVLPGSLTDRGIILNYYTANALWIESRVTTILASAIIFVSISSLMLALMLLQGTYGKRPKLLHTWIVLTSISLFVWIAICTAGSMFTFDNLLTVIVMAVLGSILVIVSQGFCLWAVFRHKREVQTEETLGVQYYSTEE